MKNFALFLLISLVFPTLIPAREITGVVTDESGAVLPGVNVTVENSPRGTLTDVNGFYKIQLQPEDKVLVFSFIGMDTEKVKIKDQSRIDVVLKVSALEMEECIVVGYGISSERRTKAASQSIRIRGMSTKQCLNFTDTEWDTENYATVHENGFKEVSVNPLSTFSIDVDNASYSNVRRYLNQGQLPPKDAVRVEEMINYFSYDYPEPEGEHPFSVTTELGTCPWNSDNYLMRVGLKGKSIDKSDLPPSNLVFLIDVSGSMTPENKLPLLKKAFALLVNELRQEDRVAIVVYAGAAGKVLDSTPGNKKEKILEALDNLQAGGSTAGGAGLKLAYRIARENFIQDGNNRIILATDGDFNVGVSSTSEMERLVEQERESGIFMSVLGFGMGNIKDDKMETIADKGNGNYSYIDNIQEARKVLVSEFGGTLFTIAKDVKFQLEFNSQQVQQYRLVGYENRLLNDEDFNDDTKDAGEMGAGHTVTALYEIVPAGKKDQKPSVDPLKYSTSVPVSGDYAEELLTIKLRYKDPDGKKSKLLEQAVENKLNTENSVDFNFAASVASFGMWLRDSDYKGTTSADQILKLAKAGRGNDYEGYRSEFVRLVRTVEDLDLLSKK
ncbi:vWA domain-containing protein [Mangrovibacterium diazotrophicum]|uniref:Ca-activated chloride channel family protein n=1 Tax=Mangrovibacterium diazotrophicum TaxID=1261403 RepID=A0A419W385_9BACT|nr:VWA domain-containing protein [Mangrovibacterium diazotrophicum]RKD89928.1 Ca-activated chloride channel family protein [Mangrovibacterium diazotrophicum]